MRELHRSVFKVASLLIKVTYEMAFKATHKSGVLASADAGYSDSYLLLIPDP